MKIRYWLSLIALGVSAVSQPAWGWKETGHQEVVALAWSILDQSTRHRVETLLASQQIVPKTQGLSGEAAWIAAATWPDELRKKKGTAPLAPPTTQQQWLSRTLSGEGTPVWHYMNPNIALPFAGQKSIGLLDQALPMQIKFLGDKSLTQEERAMALVWVSHLIGDAHQPTHCAARAIPGDPEKLDGGGNFVMLVDMDRVHPEPVSLHRWWDQLPGNAKPGTKQFSQDVAGLTQMSTDTSKAELGKAPIQWMEESFNIARDEVYPGLVAYPARPGMFLVSKSYRQTSRDIAKERVALAGRRLAEVVTKALTD